MTQLTDQNQLLATALRYAEMGFIVIPIRPPINAIPVTPGSTSEAWSDWHDGKTPLLQRWSEFGNYPPETIQAIWGKFPDANIGLLTGVQFDVLDIDGAEGLASLKRAVPEGYKHTGPVARTGGGGYHFLFKPTGHRSRVGILSKVDWRGGSPEGNGRGQIVVEPSVHRSGNRYQWLRPITTPLPEAPTWLMDILDSTENKPRDPQQTTVDREREDICEVAMALGLPNHRHGNRYCKARCPFHDNTHEPSLTLWHNNDRYWCSSCGATGWSDQLRERAR